MQYEEKLSDIYDIWSLKECGNLISEDKSQAQLILSVY